MLLKWCQDDLPVEVEETFGEEKKEREASITNSLWTRSDASIVQGNHKIEQWKKVPITEKRNGHTPTQTKETV